MISIGLIILGAWTIFCVLLYMFLYWVLTYRTKMKYDLILIILELFFYVFAIGIAIIIFSFIIN